MSNKTALALNKHKKEIMDLWVERAQNEVSAALHQEDLALRDHLPEYLTQLENALSTVIDRTALRNRKEKKETTRIGKMHGKVRAGSGNYTMDQVIFEFHILRQVICDVLERDEVLSPLNREIIVASIEQAVNDAATEFSQTHRDMQERMTHTLAHDFRSPVTVAKLCLQQILRRPEDVNAIVGHAAKGILSLDRLNLMIKDLLDVSRLKSGVPFQLEMKEECDLGAIIQDCTNDMNISYHNRVKAQLPAEPCKGQWNEEGLRRILDNLLSNAVKHGTAGKFVCVKLTQTEDTASFSVQNFGTPIPNEEISLLFQHFKRAKGAEETIGWGLGLTVVTEMTKAHHGEVTVTSSGEDGTTFIVTIPKVMPDGGVQNEKADERPSHQAEKD
jgi:signal transduction histidine kinase